MRPGNTRGNSLMTKKVINFNIIYLPRILTVPLNPL